MEIERRMSTRFTCALGGLVLVLIAFLLACGSVYKPTFDGLLVVPSQGFALVQSFTFDLRSGAASEIAGSPTVSSVPVAVVLDPAQLYAYVTSTQTSTVVNSANLISSFKLNPSGTLSAVATTRFNPIPGVGPAIPVGLAMDTAGKFIFTADVGTPAGQGAISVFAVTGNGTLTEVPGSPFLLLPTPGGFTPDPSALAVSPTSFPSQNAACSSQPAPTSENLYVTDLNNNVVFEFGVDSSTGALGPPPGDSTVLSFATGELPSGVVVDPCNRFVFVTNQNSNTVNAYNVCYAVSGTCPRADGSLALAGSSNAGNGPGPITVDPLGQYVYAIDLLSDQISGYKISPATGLLSPLNQTVSTGNFPVSIAIRGDDQWLFVTNNGSTIGYGSVSEYTITPNTGVLTPAGTGILTATFPSGIAVK
jgi:6-phosphogluconolactonase (cycloisomerase 2 family)